MTTPRFEAFLARLLVDAVARRKFLADPKGEAVRAGLSPQEAESLAAMDRVGLALAARSFARKREQKQGPARSGAIRRWRLRFSSWQKRKPFLT